MYYPNDIISTIQSEWNNLKTNHKFQGQLPDENVLSSLLNISYQTSLKTEESRNILFRLIVCNEDDFKKAYNNSYLVNIDKFTVNRDFNVSELKRLSPAVDYTRSIIAVDYNHESKELYIWGIINIGSDWYNYVNGNIAFFHNPIFPPSFFTITVDGIASLKISKGGFCLLKLKDGDIQLTYSSALETGLINDFIQEGIVSYQERGTSLLKFQDVIKIDFKRYYIQFMKHILSNISSHRHGGALIVLSETKNNIDEICHTDLKIKYMLNSNISLGDNILMFLINFEEFIYLNNKTIKNEHQINNDLYESIMSLQKNSQGEYHKIIDLLNHISNLANVDGAVVMTNSFKIIGFGAEINCNYENLKECVETNDQMAKDCKSFNFENYGTRHRSAIKFASKYPDSIVFVISQDGGIKGIKSNSDKVIVWPNVDMNIVDI